MATKAGMAQFKDFKQGRTFYEVRMDLDEYGFHDVCVTPLMCHGKPWKKKLKEIDRRVPKIGTIDYTKEFLIHLHESKWKHLPKSKACGMFLFVYSRSLIRNDVCFRRLFVTRKAAERFAGNLRQYFQPSKAQKEYAMWHHDWTNREELSWNNHKA